MKKAITKKVEARHDLAPGAKAKFEFRCPATWKKAYIEKIEFKCRPVDRTLETPAPPDPNNEMSVISWGKCVVTKFGRENVGRYRFVDTLVRLCLGMLHAVERGESIGAYGRNRMKVALTVSIVITFSKT